MPKPYRHLIGLLVAFLVAWCVLYVLSMVFPVDLYSGGSVAPGIVLLIAMCGLVMGFLQWVGLWLVFGPGRYFIRVLVSTLACLLGLAVMLAALLLESGSDSNAWDFIMEWLPSVLLLFPFFFLVLQLPSAVLRFFSGWRIEWGNTPKPERPLAISDLLTLTTVIAIGAASRSWIDLEQMPKDNLEVLIAFGILWLPGLLLFAYPILYFTCTPWRGGWPEHSVRPGWKGVGLAIYVSSMLLGILAFTNLFVGGRWEELTYVSCLVFTLAFSLCFSLGWSRRFGFRLWTRWSRRAFEREHEARGTTGEPRETQTAPLERTPWE